MNEQVHNITRIAPRTEVHPLDLRELWSYRELLMFLALRDLQVRYKQTVLGVAWSIVQPLALMATFAIFFGQLARVSSDGVPYALFALAALTPWQLFERVLAGASASLVNEQRLITKVYFPRVIIPLSTTLSAAVDFVIALGLFSIISLVFGFTLGWQVGFIPILSAILLSNGLGLGILLAALNVKYRDIQQVIPFVLRVGFFLTPVVYSSSLVPERFQVLYSFNPMVGIVDGFRWALLGIGSFPAFGLLISTITGITFVLLGLFVFRVREPTFADSLG